MTERLREIANSNRLSYISEVRGLGAMVSFELVKDRTSREPNPELTGALTTKGGRQRPDSSVLRTLRQCRPDHVPLTASDAIVDEGLGLVERSLREVVDGA